MRTLDHASLSQYFADLPDRAHGAIIYTDDAVRYPLMFGFLKAGLERNWLCLYATMADSPEPMQQRMNSFGLYPEEHPDDLVIRTGKSLFGSREEPDWEKWVSNIDLVFEWARHRGKRGIRWAGELPNYFLRVGKLDKWFRMEEAFDERSPHYSILCAYDARIAFGRSVADVIEHYKELPRERRRFADMHSFSVFSLDDQTYRLVDNVRQGLHPAYPSYPRPDALGLGGPF